MKSVLTEGSTLKVGPVNPGARGTSTSGHYVPLKANDSLTAPFPFVERGEKQEIYARDNGFNRSTLESGSEGLMIAFARA